MTAERDELDALLLEERAGTLDESDRDRLREMLRSSETARARYVELQTLSLALELESGTSPGEESSQREVPVAEFVTGNRQTVLGGDELLTAIVIPLPAAEAVSTFLKLGARRFLVISIAMVAARVDVHDGEIVAAQKSARGNLHRRIGGQLHVIPNGNGDYGLVGLGIQLLAAHRADLDAWIGCKPFTWLALNSGLGFRWEGEMHGTQSGVSQNPPFAPARQTVPTAFGENYGGMRLEAMLGVNVLAAGNHQIGLDLRVPLWQDVNGYRLGQDLTATIGWKTTF